MIHKMIYLTEEQLKYLIKKVINESISEKITSKQISNTKSEIANGINGLIKGGNKNMLDLINNLGYNIDYNNDDREAYMNSLYDENGRIKDEVSRTILNYANELKQYISSNGGIKQEFNSLPIEKQGELLRARDMLDKLGLNRLYDSSITRVSNNELQFGLYYDADGNLKTDNFNLNKYTDKKLKKDFKGNVKSLYRSLLNRYTDSMYGLNVSIPGDVYKDGNSKLPSDTLIVNFTSAERCPAWNTCILKNACYARAGEKQHSNVMYGNARKNIMWEAGHTDPKLLNLMFRLLREYAVDYETLSEELMNNGIVNEETEQPWRPEELSSLHFSDKRFPQEALDIINSNNGIKRINDIRLNENGDFIGQWLVDAVDAEAGDFKTINISTTAYTCRILNYQNIRNIILNASNAAIKGPGVVRQFLALKDVEYRSFDETYDGPNNQLVINEDGMIHMNPQPLYINNRPTGEYYYKCPCGVEYEKNKKANCYMCRTCYLDEKFNGIPYYVFVNAHGGDKKEFKGRKMAEIGVSKNYFENLNRILNGNKVQPQQKPEEYDMIGESLVETPNNMVPSDEAAIKQVVRNTIYSVNIHLNDLYLNGGDI